MMRFFLFTVVLLLCGVSVVDVSAGAPASSAAVSLGRGVKLGQPLASAGSSSALPLVFSASTADLCPVIKYSTSVEPVDDDASLNKLIPIQGKYASDAKANAAPGSKPMKIVFKPLTYINNQTVPSVDWVDVHFRVESGVQQSLQMKVVSASGDHMASDPAAHPSAESDHSMMMESNVGASFEFGPIYLTKQDTLTYAFTVCASMIDCNTEVHTFKEPADSEAQQLQHKPQLNQQPALSLFSPPVQQQEQEKLQPKYEQLKQQQEHEELERKQQQLQQERLEQQQRQQAQQSPAQAREAQSASGCPAVSYTYKLDCGDSECKASFVNLSPEKPLDWVDIHLVRTDESMMDRLLSLSRSGPILASKLTDAAIDVQQNYQMKLAAGEMGHMSMSSSGEHDEAILSSHEHTLKFGAASLPATVLQESGGAQVFQLPIPLQFKDGDMVGVFFTYCQNGTDCDSEIAFFKLEDDGTGSSHSAAKDQQQQIQRAEL